MVQSSNNNKDDKKSLVKCEICACSVRKDRLEKHIKKIHNSSITSTADSKLKVPSSLKHSRKSKSMLVPCSICKSFVGKDQLALHKRLFHSITPVINKPSKKTTRGTDKNHSLNQGITNYGFTNPGHIILISKRGMRVQGGRCAECGIYDNFMWQYAKSNHGTVCICSNCKARVFDRSFGKARLDLLDLTYKS